LLRSPVGSLLNRRGISFIYKKNPENCGVKPKNQRVPDFTNLRARCGTATPRMRYLFPLSFRGRRDPRCLPNCGQPFQTQPCGRYALFLSPRSPSPSSFPPTQRFGLVVLAGSYRYPGKSFCSPYFGWGPNSGSHWRLRVRKARELGPRGSDY